MSLGFPSELTEKERGLITLGGSEALEINLNSRRSAIVEETKSR